MSLQEIVAEVREAFRESRNVRFRNLKAGFLRRRGRFGPEEVRIRRDVFALREERFDRLTEVVRSTREPAVALGFSTEYVITVRALANP
jgi:hypothetical protein